MKRSFKNFVLLTLGISVGATAIIMTLDYMLGLYSYFIYTALFFISLAWMIVQENQKKWKH